jgi:dsDNA-binding SOS-regulon protein
MDVVEKKYTVVRSGVPITNEEMSLEEAKKELDRWQKILARWPDGTKVKIQEITK